MSRRPRHVREKREPCRALDTFGRARGRSSSLTVCRRDPCRAAAAAVLSKGFAATEASVGQVHARLLMADRTQSSREIQDRP